MWSGLPSLFSTVSAPPKRPAKTIMPSSGKRVDGVALRDWHIEHVLNRTMEKEAAKFNKINFQWLELPCQSAFTDAFGGIDTDKVPTMILLNPKRRRYTIFTGVYNVGPNVHWVYFIIDMTKERLTFFESSNFVTEAGAKGCEPFQSCWFCRWSVSISRFSLAIRLSVGVACADAAAFLSPSILAT